MANFLIPFDAGTEAQHTFDVTKLQLVGGNAETKNLGLKGLTFDGLDDGLKVADHNDFDFGAGDFAFTYLLIPVLGSALILTNKDDTFVQRQFQIAILADGKAQIAYWKAGSVGVIQATIASQFTTGVFTTAIFQKRAGSFQIYINGLIVSLGTLIGTHGAMQSTNADIFIGTGEAGALPYNGWMSRSSIHSQSFSATEAATFHAEIISREIEDVTLPIVTTALWPMDDGAEGTSADGDVVRDLLNGNKHHADGNDGANNTGLTWNTRFELVRYDSKIPSITKTAGDTDPTFQNWTNFVEMLGGGNQVVWTHQLSEDGITWKFWNGAAWVEVVGKQFNIASIINTNILTFPTATKSIFVRSFPNSNGAQKGEIDLIQVGFSTNQAPIVDAGTNKFTNDNLSISLFSDSSFSDPEGTIDKVFYKIVGEVDIFTEILIGGFGTLLEAVQAFQYQFLNPGIITAILQVEDNLGETSEDSLTVTVSKYTTNWSVKNTEGNHLQHVKFDPGDGSGELLKDSPFTHDFEFGESHVEVSKPGWIKIEEDINITVNGQSFFIVLDEFLGKGDIDAIATVVAQKINRPTDILMVVENDDLEMVVENDDLIDIIIEE